MNYEYHKAGLSMVFYVLGCFALAALALAGLGLLLFSMGWVVDHAPNWVWFIFWPVVIVGGVYGFGYAVAEEQAEHEAKWAAIRASKGGTPDE